MTTDTVVLTPRPEEARIADLALRKTRFALLTDDLMHLRIDGETEEIEVPRSAIAALDRALASVVAGEPFSVVSAHDELTTQQAADLLGVSRPFLIRLLEEGKVAYRKVGSHRRVDAASLLDFKSTTDKKSRAAIDELSAETFELGFAL
jgi:excisionase family DNA binding protein